MKLKDFLNKKVNSANQQISFDIKKKKLKEFDMDIDDILDIDLIKKGKKKAW